MFVITVPSTDKSTVYTIRKVGDLWTCDCKGHVNHSKGEAYTCTHIGGLAASLFDHVKNSAVSKPAKSKLELI